VFCLNTECYERMGMPSCGTAYLLAVNEAGDGFIAGRQAVARDKAAVNSDLVASPVLNKNVVTVKMWRCPKSDALVPADEAGHVSRAKPLCRIGPPMRDSMLSCSIASASSERMPLAAAK
jgi:hypothetical protein